ncbi:phospholipase D-like domain-containing protein [Thiohalomonas denitrificans]|uniref:Phosphatidylserine/phosphatidylglycerophosphate/cardiolipin synthase n=1 Tax=Thiohalomonas denitrificans TaxID=415747 RepID=A0A1G5Q7L3_9GAMM|nr:phosphatidylserine/phosphatidylglycerophosphate/cardiolipin synthase family protein [Thiohalomonas denitrificans]SCZ57657.1 Phosphatidylserine/phosphatidylglycerophosphate/cardiolipin synthase [Thiohalomonas denitrificans]
MKARTYRYPWRDGNRFRLLVDGAHFFPVMLQAIDESRQYILFEMYLMESGQIASRFIDALSRATERGVRTHLLLDHYGAGELSRHDRRRLIQAGVELVYYNPVSYGRFHGNLFRDHRKLLLIDGRLAYVGGTGITDDFDPSRHPELSWHETMVEVQGPCVADWHNLFEKNRERWASTPLGIQLPVPEPLPAGRPGRVVMNAPARAEVKRSLLKRIRGARQRVWIATAYFIPSRKIRRALRRAVARGADVRLLLPGPLTDLPPVRHAGRRYYGRLLRHGVRIFEYQPRFLHAKVLMCDEWVSIGSSNVDRWNFSWNLEANQEIDDPELRGAAGAMFERDFQESYEYSCEGWFARPWYRRWREWFWGIIEQWMERRTQQRRNRHGP